MKKEKLINEIDVTIESIRMHVKRLKGDGHIVRKIDMDLLIDKTRELYDNLIKLDEFAMPFGTGLKEKSEKEMEVIISEERIEEKMSVDEAANEAFEKEMPEGMVDPEEQEVETMVQEDEEEPLEEMRDPVEPEEQEVETLMHKREELTSPEAPEEPSEAEESRDVKDQTEPQKEKAEAKSTIDLFSTSAEPTLGDRLKGIEQPTIADKINKNAINELREAIGINEKFLFINELFNGDMSRYNKIIDELEGLTTLEGVNTYMLELKIQSQWRDDNAALLKLTELLQRKFLK